MRPGQQNRRPRGRTNNNGGSSSSNNNANNNRGRQQNPLARSYESSGPDVKIRGNAQHIAERYAQLARDSLSSGDRVMAENYLQHAEHYNRIIAAALLQQAQFTEQQRREWDEEAAEGEGDDSEEGSLIEPQAENGQHGTVDGAQPGTVEVQPQANGQTNHRERGNYQNRNERQDRQPRQDRNNQDRNGQDRNNQDRNNQDRQPRASFVAPIDDSQPVIEGTPAEFAGAEAEGLARTLGLARAETRVEKRASDGIVSEDVVEPAEKEVVAVAPRPRRAPRKAAPVAEISTIETAGE